MVSAVNKQKYPDVISGFENISRTWDVSYEISSAKILPGEYYVTRNNELINTVLGSCVSACIRDIDTGVGGMNHFMLPSGDTSSGSWSVETRFGVAAMEALINEILKQGARKNRLEIKLFGGGEILSMQTTNVGTRNVEFALKFMELEGYNIASQDLGGPHPRKVLFFPYDGRVMVRRLRSLQAQTIASEENRYESSISSKEQFGTVELFG